jgi:hypothetical protein
VGDDETLCIFIRARAWDLLAEIERRDTLDWTDPPPPPDIPALARWLTTAFSPAKADRRASNHFLHVIAGEHGRVVELAVRRCCQVLWRQRLH